MIKLCTFCDQRMTTSAAALINSWHQWGFADYSLWREADLPEWLYYHHPEMRANSRGFGWWAWKPFIVSEEVCKAQDGDIIVYADSGQMFKDTPRHVLDVMDSDLFLFSNGWPHADWCKGDTSFEILGRRGMHADAYKQPQASLIFIRVSETSRRFVKEWFAWSLMPGLVDNSPSDTPNFPTFQEHRHDQAILGCMAIKYGIKLHWFPSTTGHHVPRGDDKYPEITDHHRKRNEDWT